MAKNDGNVRDALNIALAKIDELGRLRLDLFEQIKELEDEVWELREGLPE